MSPGGIDRALDRLFPSAAAEGLSRSLSAEPEQMETRSTGIPKQPAIPTQKIEPIEPVNKPPTLPPEPTEDERITRMREYVPDELMREMLVNKYVPDELRAELDKQQRVNVGLFSVPQTPQEWVSSLLFWLGKGGESYVKYIAEPLAANIVVPFLRQPKPKPTPEQDVILKELARRGFPHYVEMSNLEWWLKKRGEIPGILTRETLEIIRPYKEATTDKAMQESRIQAWRDLPHKIFRSGRALYPGGPELTLSTKDIGEMTADLPIWLLAGGTVGMAKGVKPPPSAVKFAEEAVKSGRFEVFAPRVPTGRPTAKQFAEGVTAPVTGVAGGGKVPKKIPEVKPPVPEPSVPGEAVKPFTSSNPRLNGIAIFDVKGGEGLLKPKAIEDISRGIEGKSGVLAGGEGHDLLAEAKAIRAGEFRGTELGENPRIKYNVDNNMFDIRYDSDRYLRDNQLLIEGEYRGNLEATVKALQGEYPDIGISILETGEFYPAKLPVKAAKPSIPGAKPPAFTEVTAGKPAARPVEPQVPAQPAAGAPPVQPPPPPDELTSFLDDAYEKILPGVVPNLRRTAARQLGQVPGRLTEMPDLQSFETAVDYLARPDNWRKIGQLKPFQPVAKLLGGKNAKLILAREKAFAGRAGQKFQADNLSVTMISDIEAIGGSKRLFKLNADNVIRKGQFKGLSPYTIAEFPERYWDKLTPKQQAWITKIGELHDWKTDFLKRNNIPFEELSFEEGGRYIGRIWMKKVNPVTGEIEDIAFLGGQGNVLRGGKQAALKYRSFKTFADGQKEGFVAFLPEEALFHNIQGAYYTKINRDFTEYTLKNYSWRSTEIGTLSKANTLINTALKKGYIRPQSIEALKRDMPEIGNALEKILQEQDWTTRKGFLDGLKTQIINMTPSGTDKLWWKVSKLHQEYNALKGALQSIERVKRGERLPTGTIKALEKILPQASGLRDASKLSLQDLIRAGKEASEFPKTLHPPRKEALIQAETALAQAQAQLAQNPNNAMLFREVQRLKRKVAFTKYRMRYYAETKEGLEFSKSPSSILKGEHYQALEELKDILRGAPYKATTAGGKETTKYQGGVIAEAQRKWTEAKLALEKMQERARTTRFAGEAEVNLPSFKGKILTGPEAKELKAYIEKEMRPEISKSLNATNQVNAVARAMALSSDFSLPGIQLIMMPWTHPESFVRGALKGMVQGFFDPKYHAKLLRDNGKLIANSPGMIITKGGATEFTEFTRSRLAQAALTKPALKPLAVVEKVIKTAMSPWIRAYEAGLDAAGIYMKQGMQHMAKDAYLNSQVDAHINLMRGVFSSRRIGIGSTQRQIESLAMLAAGYTRAIAAILFDASRGNLRGRLAREALIKTAFGMTAMGVAFSKLKGESDDETVDHLMLVKNGKYNPNFFTWDIGGQRIGPGSKLRAILVLIAKSATNPKSLLKLSRQNPALMFAWSNTSPIISTSVDLLTGANYIGDPTREDLPQLTKTTLGENLIPLWVQDIIYEGGTPEEIAARASVTYFGGRAYPKSPYELREELRNKLAMEKHGVLWEDLPTIKGYLTESGGGELAQDKLLRESPELQALEQQVTERFDRLADEEQQKWNRWKSEGQVIEEQFRENVAIAELEFQKTGDPQLFKDKLSDAASMRRGAYAARDNNDEYQEIIESFKEPLSLEQKLKRNPLDLARQEYYEQMYAPEMYDFYNNYDWDEADRREALFVAKHGKESLDYVKEYMNLKTDDLKLYQERRNAMKTLSAYYEIADNVPEKYAKTPDIYVSKEREKMRRMYPEIDALVNLWGSATTVLSKEAATILEKKVERLGIDKTKIKALNKEKKQKETELFPQKRARTQKAITFK